MYTQLAISYYIQSIQCMFSNYVNHISVILTSHLISDIMMLPCRLMLCCFTTVHYTLCTLYRRSTKFTFRYLFSRKGSSTSRLRTTFILAGLCEYRSRSATKYTRAECSKTFRCTSQCFATHGQGRIGNEKVICHVMGLGAPYRKFQSQLQ